MDASTLAKLYAIDGPFVGPDPVHVAVSAQELLDLGADGRFVDGGTEQAPAHGVGALLRYAD